MGAKSACGAVAAGTTATTAPVITVTMAMLRRGDDQALLQTPSHAAHTKVTRWDDTRMRPANGVHTYRGFVSVGPMAIHANTTPMGKATTPTIESPKK